MSQPSLFYWDSQDFDWHHGPENHPERPARLDAVRAALAPLHSRGLRAMEPQPIDASWLRRVHCHDYLERLLRLCAFGGGQLDADTYIVEGTERAALLAAGAVHDAVLSVLGDQTRRAFCAVRPPGHHARPEGGMGFCILNNVAIGAEVALAQPGVERVAIIDFDVHHGNGTQEVFEQRSDVFYASIHQSPCFPSTGSALDIGFGAGQGSCLNVPVAPGSGDESYLQAWELIEVALEKYRPQILLVSAGFDAHQRDPLAELNVSTEGFAELSQRIVLAAERICEGRIVSVLEGGYDLTALAESTRAHVEALMGKGLS
ncbi:MAG: histone deacetylase [Polyangiaceae bacterium]|nr:histone deacetylase [Polyangiaceae bacterium]